MYYINVRGIGSFITLFATEVGIADISLFFLFNALAIAVTRPFSGKLYDAKGHSFVIIPGVIITFAGIILLSYTTTIPSLIIAAACYGSGFGAIQPTAWMIDRVAPHDEESQQLHSSQHLTLALVLARLFLDSLHIYKLRNCISLFLSTTYCFPVHLHYKCKKQKHGDKNTEKAAG